MSEASGRESGYRGGKLVMVGQPKEEMRRDELLKRLLKTPPKPRPKRERGKDSPPKRESPKSGKGEPRN